MSTSTFDLETEVLNLPAEARVRLLEKLMASLEPPTPAKKAWVALAQKRREETLSGKTQLISGETAVAQIKTKYS